MMKIRIALLLTLLSYSISYSQNGSVEGWVWEKKNTPVKFATIYLFDTENHLVTGTFVDSTGYFKLNKIKSGAYYLKASSVLHEPDSVRIQITEDKRHYKLLPIVLSERINRLDEVVISTSGTQEISNLRNNTFRFSEEVKALSSTSVELLQKIPTVTVDPISEAVSVEGQGDVLILIDGVRQNDNKVLKSIPSHLIEKIEVSTVPTFTKGSDSFSSAINVVLKKKLRGFLGNFKLDLPTEIIFNDSYVSARYDHEKFAISGKYRLYIRNFPYREHALRSSPFSEDVYERNKVYTDRMELGHDWNFGLNYSPAKNHTLRFNTALNTTDNTRKFTTSSKDRTDNDYYSDIVKTERIGEIEGEFYSVNYNITSPKLKNTFELSSDFYKFSFAGNRKQFDDLQSTELVSTENLLEERWYSRTLSNMKIAFDSIQTLNVGAELYIQEMNTLSQGDIAGEIFYKENRINAFAEYEILLGKFLVSAGMKAEKYSVDIEGAETQDKWVMSPKLYVVFRQNSIKSSFSFYQRLYRPRVWDINPVRRFSDNRTATEGNPYLEPEIYNRLELRNQYSSQKFTAINKIYYTRSENAIQHRRFHDDGILVSKPFNASWNERIGTYSSLRYSPWKKLNLEISSDLYHSQFEQPLNSLERTKSAWSYNLGSSIEWQPLNKLSFRASIEYSAKRFMPYSYTTSPINTYYAISYTPIKKLTINALICNPWLDLESKSVYVDDENHIETKSVLEYKMLMLRVSYNFSLGTVKDSNLQFKNFEKDF